MSPESHMEAPETPKASPGHLQDAPKTSKMSLRSSKICIPRPEPLKTHRILKKPGFGRRPRIGKIYVKIWRFWALLGRSWENVFFRTKNCILAGDPELAKFTSKSSDSGHFWADPGKMCFLVPKTGFWPATQNWQNLRQNLTILGTFGPILGKCVFSYQKLDFGRRPRIGKIYVKI